MNPLLFGFKVNKIDQISFYALYVKYIIEQIQIALGEKNEFVIAEQLFTL